ncbi:prepilin-type N-terminal cleavage/methylation domain-containing protein [Kiritimatiellaeota bacterium B1221]|nr:prepilin-type N-terminal cleavage/methylation domain-containing protein [Kiritimatiellaeota bacterium B1221]
MKHPPQSPSQILRSVPRPPQSREAFTLIEMLVVIAIIAMLVSLLSPAIRAARASAKKAVCAGNLHEIGEALLLYANEHGGSMPIETSWSNKWYTKLETYVPNESKRSAWWCPAETISPPKSAYQGSLRPESYGIWFSWDEWQQGKKYNYGKVPAKIWQFATPSQTGLIYDGHVQSGYWVWYNTSKNYRHQNGTSVNILYMDGRVGSQSK